MLAYFVVEQGCANLRTFCLTNELSLGKWGALLQDLPRFQAYHQAFFDEFAARKLPVGLLATDASPISNWHSIEWATKHMDDITAVYGGHHYINGFPLDDPNFHPWVRGAPRLGARAWPGAKGKDLHHRRVRGQAGRQYRERQAQRRLPVLGHGPGTLRGASSSPRRWIAALTPASMPSATGPSPTSPTSTARPTRTSGGLFKWTGTDYSTRPHYYSYGMITKYLRGPARVLRVTTNDPFVRAAAIQRASDGAITVLLVNRNPGAVRVELDLGTVAVPAPAPLSLRSPAPAAPSLRRPARPPTSWWPMAGSRLVQDLPPQSQVLLTAAYETTPPAPATGIAVRPQPTGVSVSWHPVDADDLCYYRVYRLVDDERRQVGLHHRHPAHRSRRTPRPTATRWSPSTSPATPASDRRQAAARLEGRQAPEQASCQLPNGRAVRRALGSRALPGATAPQAGERPERPARARRAQRTRGPRALPCGRRATETGQARRRVPLRFQRRIRHDRLQGGTRARFACGNDGFRDPVHRGFDPLGRARRWPRTVCRSAAVRWTRFEPPEGPNRGLREADNGPSTVP